MLGIGIDTLVTFNPLTVSVHTPIDEALGLMSRHGIHHLPVVDGDWALVGMVSDLDLSRVIDELPAVLEATTHDPQQLAGAMPYVGEVLTQAVQYIAPSDPPSAALELIVQNQFHCVPVVHAGRLEGIITSTDFLRELSYGESHVARRAVSRHLRPQPARIDATTGLDEAARLMAQAGNYLLVCAGVQPRGVLSHRQLRRARLGALLAHTPWLEDAHHWQALARSVGELLPIDEQAVRPDQSLAHAARVMLELRVQGLPVIDAARRLCGVVTERDLLDALLG